MGAERHQLLMECNAPIGKMPAVGLTAWTWTEAPGTGFSWKKTAMYQP